MSSEDEQTSNLQHLAPMPPDNDGGAQSRKPIDRWLTLFGVAVGLILYLFPKTTPALVVFLCLVLFALLVHPAWNFWWIEDKRWRQIVAIIALATFVAWVGHIAWPESALDRTPSTALAPTPVPTPAYYPTPLTLRQLFDTDFDERDTGQVTDAGLTNASTGKSVTFTLRECLDPTDNAKFIAVYAPDSTDSFGALWDLPRHIPSILREWEQRYQIGTKLPGETSSTWSRNMVFGGRVYIYYENDFSLQQLAEIEKRFREHHYFVQFRGQDYLVLHWNEKRRVLNYFCAPGFKLNSQKVCQPINPP